jgi:hypothetical protein
MMVSRFGVLWKPMRFDITRVAEIVSACMRLQNYYIAVGIPPIRTAMTHDERTVSDAEFYRWCTTTTSQRDDTGDSGGQGRRSDLSKSVLGYDLTTSLAENDITRPRYISYGNGNIL